MALTVSVATNSATSEGTGTTITFTANVPATATCVWVAWTIDDQGTTTRNFTAVWDSGVSNQAMTQVSRKTDATDNHCFAVHRRLAPVTGTAVTFLVSADVAFGNRAWRAIVIYAEDGNTTTPEDGVQLVDPGLATSSGTTVTSATGDVVVSFVTADGRTVGTTDSNESATPDLGEFNTGGAISLGGEDYAGAASVTTGWTWGGGSVRTAEIAFNIKAAAAGGTTMTPGQGPLTLTGTGLGLGFTINMPDEL
jgi:hypothetical protein